MPTWSRVHRAPWIVVPLVVAAALLAGCSSGGSSASTAPAQVKSAWTTFFKGSTPVATRANDLQDGTQLEGVLRAQLGSPFAKGLSAHVTHVTVRGEHATVTYDLLVDGTLLLSGQTGQAVNLDGRWVVGVGSFCGLLALEHVSPPACAQG